MNIKKETILRTIILVIALTNQALTSAGKCPLPFDNETVNEFLSNSFTIFASLWAWWKNNSFTYEACIADEQLKEMKGK